MFEVGRLLSKAQAPFEGSSPSLFSVGVIIRNPATSSCTLYPSTVPYIFSKCLSSLLSLNWQQLPSLLLRFFQRGQYLYLMCSYVAFLSGSISMCFAFVVKNNNVYYRKYNLYFSCSRLGHVCQGFFSMFAIVPNQTITHLKNYIGAQSCFFQSL